MKSPATIDGIALIASTIMRTGRASRPPISLRKIAVEIAERHREQRRDADHLERADDARAEPPPSVAGLSGPTSALVLGEELRAERVEAAGDRVRRRSAPSGIEQADRRRVATTTRASRSRACERPEPVARDEPRRSRGTAAYQVTQKPSAARERREPLVDQPRRGRTTRTRSPPSSTDVGRSGSARMRMRSSRRSGVDHATRRLDGAASRWSSRSDLRRRAGARPARR